MDSQHETDEEEFGEPNELDLGFREPCSRHGHRSKKIPAATYVRDYFINFTKSPKKLKKCVIFGNPNWLEV